MQSNTSWSSKISRKIAITGTHEEMIRDCLVVGKKLHLDAIKLTLETVKTTFRQKEAVREQQQALKGAEGVANLTADA